jgi:hypothetical protein
MSATFKPNQYITSNTPHIINAQKMKKRGYVQERILRVLLNNIDKDLTKYRIAKLSHGNISWIIETLRKLEADNILENTKVKDFNKLIILWQKLQIEPLFKRDYMLRNPLKLIKDTKLQYAFTTYQAENLLQNHLFPSRIDFYINLNDIWKWNNILAKEGLVGKGNIRVLSTDDHVFYDSFEIKGYRLVSIPQLIVDLLNEGGVCIEAANKLIERVPKNVVPRL